MINSNVGTRNDHLGCPACGRLYEMGVEEYCQVDGERLEVRLADQSDQVGPVQPQTPLNSENSISVTAPIREEAHENVEEVLISANHAQNQQQPTKQESRSVEDPSLLESLLNRMGLRKRTSAGDQTLPDDNVAPAKQVSMPVFDPALSSDDGNNPLPPQVIEKGWHVAGSLVSNEAMDVWQVARSSDAGSAYARFCRFRARVLTTPSLYAHLGNHSCAALPTLLDHGTVNLKGHARASFELTLLPNKSLQPMQAWINRASPSEEKALSLLPHLVQMLTELAAAGVHPISFSPAQMLRNADDGRIVLDNLAALAETGCAHTDYRPELDQNALISRLWSAPELAEQLVVSPKGATFCVGQLLTLALWGQPLDAAALRAGNVPFVSISDARLARVLQGCLWVESIQGRWGLDQLQAALTVPLDQMPPVEDWAQLGPRAMGKAFALAGRTYWRVEDLLAQAVLPQNWIQATARLSAMLDWIESGSPWASVAKHLRNQLEAGRSSDYVLIQMAHAVIPDLPLTWRGLDFSDDHARASLVNLAQRNLATDTSSDESDLLEALFRADLRGAFATTGRPT